MPRLHALIRRLGMLPALLVTAVGFDVLSSGRFFTATNVNVLLYQVAINLVLASGMTFVVLTGGIDLSIGSILAASAVTGLMTSHLDGSRFAWVGVSLAVGAGFGLTNGLLISRLRLPPFLLTLASLTVVLGLARALTGDMTIYSPDLPYPLLGSGSLLGVPTQALIAILVVLVAWFILDRTVLGVSIYAVGGNEAAARLSGIDVARVQRLAYGLSGLLAGLGAIMLSSRLRGANAMQIGSSYTLDAITAVILGGTSFAGGVGSIWGTMVGALLIVVLSDGLILTGVSDMWQHVAKGLVIIAAVALDRGRLAGSTRA